MSRLLDFLSVVGIRWRLVRVQTKLVNGFS